VRIYYIGGTGKWIGVDWYISCHLMVRKMAEVVHSVGRNQKAFYAYRTHKERENKCLLDSDREWLHKH